MSTSFSLPQQFRPRHRASNSPWSSSSGWPSCCDRAPLRLWHDSTRSTARCLTRGKWRQAPSANMVGNQRQLNTSSSPAINTSIAPFPSLHEDPEFLLNLMLFSMFLLLTLPGHYSLGKQRKVKKGEGKGKKHREAKVISHTESERRNTRKGKRRETRETKEELQQKMEAEKEEKEEKEERRTKTEKRKRRKTMKMRTIKMRMMKREQRGQNWQGKRKEWKAMHLLWWGWTMKDKHKQDQQKTHNQKRGKWDSTRNEAKVMNRRETRRRGKTAIRNKRGKTQTLFAAWANSHEVNELDRRKQTNKTNRPETSRRSGRTQTEEAGKGKEAQKINQTSKRQRVSERKKMEQTKEKRKREKRETKGRGNSEKWQTGLLPSPAGYTWGWRSGQREQITFQECDEIQAKLPRQLQLKIKTEGRECKKQT